LIRISAFPWVPPFAQGLVRDLRVRWALEEAGLDYEVRLLTPDDQRSDSYRALQPFGQVPTYEGDGLELFESGAIVLHIAEHSESLAPDDPTARARVRTWVLAALNSVEPPIGELASLDLFHADEPSIADLAVYSMLLVLRNGPIPGTAEALLDRPALAAFLDRMAGRIKSMESSGPSGA